jgi:hypothetical protein
MIDHQKRHYDSERPITSRTLLTERRTESASCKFREQQRGGDRLVPAPLDATGNSHRGRGAKLACASVWTGESVRRVPTPEEGIIPGWRCWTYDTVCRACSMLPAAGAAPAGRTALCVYSGGEADATGLRRWRFPRHTGTYHVHVPRRWHAVLVHEREHCSLESVFLPPGIRRVGSNSYGAT